MRALPAEHGPERGGAGGGRRLTLEGLVDVRGFLRDSGVRVSGDGCGGCVRRVLRDEDYTKGMMLKFIWRTLELHPDLVGFLAQV